MTGFGASAPDKVLYEKFGITAADTVAGPARFSASDRSSVTNGLTYAFVLLIGGALAADALLNDWTASLFLARKFADLIQWIAFWR